MPGKLDFILHFFTGFPHGLPEDAHSNTEGGSTGTHNLLDLPKEECTHPHRLHYRSLWRSDGASAEKNLTGECEPCRTQRRMDKASVFMEPSPAAWITAPTTDWIARIARIFQKYLRPVDGLNDGRALPEASWGGRCVGRPDRFWRWKPDPFFCYVDDLVEGIYRLLLSEYLNR